MVYGFVVQSWNAQGPTYFLFFLWESLWLRPLVAIKCRVLIWCMLLLLLLISGCCLCVRGYCAPSLSFSPSWQFLRRKCSPSSYSRLCKPLLPARLSLFCPSRPLMRNHFIFLCSTLFGFDIRNDPSNHDQEKKDCETVHPRLEFAFS